MCNYEKIFTCFANEFASTGANEFASTGANEFASTGANEFASMGANEFASTGANEFATTNALQKHFLRLFFARLHPSNCLQTIGNHHFLYGNCYKKRGVPIAKRCLF